MYTTHTFWRRTYLNKSLPQLSADDVLVRTLFSGISHGTEMNVYRNLAPQWSKYFDAALRLFLPLEKTEKPRKPDRGYWKPEDSNWDYPLAYGYANVGEIIACGSNISQISVGDLIFAYEPHQDRYVVPAAAAIKLPKINNPEIGVLFANISTAYNGVLDANIQLDDTVVIFGQGVVGLLVTQFVKMTAASQIIVVDPLRDRREMALKMGAHLALDPAEMDIAHKIRTLTNGRGADVVIEVSGSYQALQEAIRTAAYNTTVVALSWYGGSSEALNLSEEFHQNRITLKCSQVAGIAPELGATHSISRRTEMVIKSFSSLMLQQMITEVVPFSKAEDAYKLVDLHSDKVVQVVLSY